MHSARFPRDMMRFPLRTTFASCALIVATAATISAQSSTDTAPRKKAPDSAQKAAGKSTRYSAKRAKAPHDTTPAKPKGLTGQALRDSILDSMWPVKGPDQLPGAILPSKRVVAFYGNILNKRMGVLGEYEPDDMLHRLDEEVAAWAKADPATPVVPALHFIAVVAQASAGQDGKYRARMDNAVIERVMTLAKRRDAIVFLDLQVGLSTLRDEIPRLAPFLMRPNVHLGIDPEFSMKNGGLPGKKIGTYDASDVNYATEFLADLVTKNNLPPKILVVHRFTKAGLTNYKNIKLDPRVQVVIDMDGFGPPELKKGTFHNYIKAEPVQFVGWKQFFKPRNDNPRTTIAEILRLWPRPFYIQYQ